MHSLRVEAAAACGNDKGNRDLKGGKKPYPRPEPHGAQSIRACTDAHPVMGAHGRLLALCVRTHYFFQQASACATITLSKPSPQETVPTAYRA